MDAKLIEALLAERFSLPEYAYFHHFRTATGYSVTRYVDGLTVGLYQKNAGIKAFEVKVVGEIF